MEKPNMSADLMPEIVTTAQRLLCVTEAQRKLIEMVYAAGFIAGQLEIVNKEIADAKGAVK
tara:strand:+ start:926 stop:1108 length:183 start_codon:yes stop_codon:yes gene_type:complete